MNKTLIGTFLILLFGCTNAENQPTKENDNNKTETTHNYGGWYCPDNLNGFPAVDLKDWKNVPVVIGRLPTEEESRNGSSLIYVNTQEHPSAKAMDIELPKLATFYNQYSKKNEVIIVIQALEIGNDSIVGFRYLNGGNGSAHFREITFITENEVANISNARFVSFDININSSYDKVWEVMTKPEYSSKLQPVFDKNNKLNKDWRTTSNVNYYYANKNKMTGEYADMLFGNWYIQNDYLINDVAYVEKFLLLRDEKTNQTNLKVVCGPFNQDFETQQSILNKWAEKIKELSEK
ncbi:MAG: hypothetical protein HYU68_11500 [Bacteroidetes bacterium]|nr:hypothetical protein [Bacteroidota bacterium]